MTAIRTILVAGARDAALQLASFFPPPTYRIVTVTSTADALDHAARAVVVVIDTALPGGPMELCRRLRSDPVTGNLPLILRYHKGQNTTQALTDVSIAATDIDGLVRAMRTLAPELATSSTLAPDDLLSDVPEEEIFDEEPMTVIWRRPEAAPGDAAEWPPPAPVLQENQDHVEYALSFAGYLNSLIEALEDQSKLSPPEIQRLVQVSRLTPTEAESCLSLIQTAINTALMSKDLQRMRVLSSAKNSLYEKLQRLRTLVQDLPPPASEPPPLPQQARLGDALAGEKPPAAGPSQGGPIHKSQITLAAEAKAAKERDEAAQRAKDARLRQQYSTAGTARKKAGGIGRSWIWVTAAIVAVLGSGGYIAASLLAEDETKPRISSQNTPPRMTKVELLQSLSGIIAQPQATDDEEDRISFTIHWYINGQLVPDVRTARLTPDLYRVGDRVEAEVVPRDGRGQGNPMRAQPLEVKSLKRK